MGLPKTSFAGVVGDADVAGDADVVGEAITVVGVEHEADSDGSSDVLVPLFGFFRTEGSGSGDAFFFLEIMKKFSIQLYDRAK